MPLYEYTCSECGEQFEELVLSNGQTVACPKCKSEQVQKQLSVFASQGGSRGGAAESCGAPNCGRGFT